MTYRGVTFDFWNTLFVEVAPSIGNRRATLIRELLSAEGYSVSHDTIATALAALWAQHRRAWQRGFHYSAAAAAGDLILALGVKDRPAIRLAIQERLEYMYPASELRPCADLHRLLGRVAATNAKIGIVCDTGFTPGRVLRDRLNELDLGRYFAGASFSDEIGAVKPAAEAFAHSLAYLGCGAADTVHVGDLWRNDVCGARALGLSTVRYREWNDDPPPPGSADADYVSATHYDTAEWIVNPRWPISAQPPA